MKTEHILISIISEILDIEDHVDLNSQFNLFEYDSLTKINVIVALEAYAEVDSIDFTELMLCDTYGELIAYADKLRSNMGRKKW